MLPALPPPADTPEAHQLRAGLWERLGEARRKKDKAGAIAALERALELDPERTKVRTALVNLYGSQAEFADAALGNLRKLVEADPTDVDTAQALGAALAARGLIDQARCLYELCDVMGASDPAVAEFLAAHPLPQVKPDDPYPGALDDDDRRVLAGGEARVMSAVFTQLWEGAPQLLNERLEDRDVTAEDKISPMTDLDVAKLYVQIGKALGNKKTALYQRKNGQQGRLEIVVQVPPALVFGDELIAAPEPEARF